MSLLLSLLFVWLPDPGMPETFVYPADSTSGPFYVRADIFESVMHEVDLENPILPIERLKSLGFPEESFENLVMFWQGDLKAVKRSIDRRRALNLSYDNPNDCLSTTYGASHWKSFNSPQERAQQARNIYEGRIVAMERYYEIGGLTGHTIARVAISQEWRKQSNDVDTVYLVIPQGVSSFKGLNFCNFSMGRDTEAPILNASVLIFHPGAATQNGLVHVGSQGLVYEGFDGRVIEKPRGKSKQKRVPFKTFLEQTIALVKGEEAQ
ncbi:MAG: hypothetical protein QNK37_35090 [Acidobacteriota bacterium]|nr:hypothetical protein [Acidobacteriota bacterium]